VRCRPDGLGCRHHRHGAPIAPDHRGREPWAYDLQVERATIGLAEPSSASLPSSRSTPSPASAWIPHHPAGADAFNGRRDFNALVCVLAGSGLVGGERRPVRMGQLAVFGPGEVVTVTADTGQESRSPQLDVLLGGEPIREPVAAYGPFVINTRAELIQAFEDHQVGRLGTIPAEPRLGHEVLKETTEPA
jgi:redox-sensitive bicupin YhaK (pirin superfamily)